MTDAPDTARQALLLPGSIGMGHDAMAGAMAASLQSRGWATQTQDVMALLGGTGHRAGEAVFRGLLAVPGAFDALHFGALRQGTSVADWMDARAVGRIVPRLRPVVRDLSPDLVVSVFATAAAAMSRLKPELRATVTVTFCTDLNPHRLWVHPHTDCYLVKSEVSAAFVRRFDPDAHVVVAPAPVRPEFFTAPTRADARTSLGVPDDTGCVLLMGGGWGLGPLVPAATALAAGGLHVLAVAGKNAATERALHIAAARDARVHAFGFTDRVPELMAAADLVVTTPGDTCAEARVVGRRLVLLDVLAGHGRENLQHELELGGAVVASATPGLLARTVRRELDAGSDPAPDVGLRAAWEAGLDAVLATFRLGS
jgi:processive 1,2-diacylglycerol beta-glucosyltransferase